MNHGAVVTTVQPAARPKQGYADSTSSSSTGAMRVNTAPELLSALPSSKIGEEISVTYIRGRNTYNATALLTDSPPPAQ